MSAYIPPPPGFLGSRGEEGGGQQSLGYTRGVSAQKFPKLQVLQRGRWVPKSPRVLGMRGGLDISLAKYFPNRPIFRNLVGGKLKIIIDLQNLLLPGG